MADYLNRPRRWRYLAGSIATAPLLVLLVGRWAQSWLPESVAVALALLAAFTNGMAWMALYHYRLARFLEELVATRAAVVVACIECGTQFETRSIPPRIRCARCFHRTRLDWPGRINGRVPGHEYVKRGSRP